MSAIRTHTASVTVSEDTEPSIYIVCGLSGSGKTTAATMIRDELEHRFEETSLWEMSGFCRGKYLSQQTGDPSSTELAEWIVEERQEKGMDYFERELIHEIELLDTPPNVVVSGVRTPEGADAFRMAFDDVTIITLWTMPDIRYERLEAVRENYTYDDHFEWKERELWDQGSIEFYANPDYYDHIVPNHNSIHGLEFRLAQVLRDSEEWSNSPFPEGLDDEKIAQYL